MKLPCPFCGKDSEDDWFETINGLIAASCPECGASGPDTDNEQAALELWNTRPPTPPVAA